MNWLRLLRRPRQEGTANRARERLKIVVAHERADRSKNALLPILQSEILEVVGRHFDIRPEQVNVSLRREGPVSKIEVQIEFPDSADNAPGGEVAAVGLA